ncbi:MAG: archaeosortase/exosortase family protein [Bacteroidetes bacterium]|nr:archaeosortase/exosortase family protein [Bacteroidota bacterium]
MSKKSKIKELKKDTNKEKLAKKAAYSRFLKDFLPLMIAVVLWFVTLSILHLPDIKGEVQHFFTKFTLDSTLLFGKILFIPIESHSFPNITVDGFTMRVVMECTAYNFYIFVIYLSLLSPVSWKQRFVTLAIFLAAVFVVNNMRFIVLGYIGQYSAQLFHYLHDYLWNILFGFMVFLIWAWRYNSSGTKAEKIEVEQKS